MIVGSGPDYEKFINISINLGIKDNTIFTNSIPWEFIPEYYQVAHVFCTASITETQGLTVIEAMAASLPVICINDKAFNQIVENDLNGYIFNTKEEYIDRILSLINDRKKLTILSDQARMSSKNHSIESYAENILTVYNRCIENSNKEKNKKWYKHGFKKKEILWC